MELLISILVGVLFATGVYMILARRLLPVILGTSLLTYGVLLFLMTSGNLKRGNPPILVADILYYVDSLPQALILTAIVINFAVTAFCLVLAYRVYQDNGTDEIEELTGTAPKDSGGAAGSAGHGRGEEGGASH